MTALPLFYSADCHADLKWNDVAVQPDARSAVHACEGWSRTSGLPGLCLARGVERLEAIPALATPWGDGIDVCLVLLVAAQDVDECKETAAPVSRNVLHVSKSADRKRTAESLREIQGTRVVLVNERIPAAEVRKLLRDITKALIERGDVLAGMRSREVISSRNVPTTDHEIVFKMLRQARQPVLLVDRRTIVQNPPDSILRLSSELSAPILLTTSASAAPPELIAPWISKTDALVVPATNVVWMRAFLAADLIVALGARLRESEAFGLHDFDLPRAEIVQVHPQAFRTDPGVKLFINSYAAEFAANVLTLVARRRPEGNAPVLHPAVIATRAEWWRTIENDSAQLKNLLDESADQSAEASPIDPAYVAREIVAAAPDNALFLGEGNGSGMWLWSYLWKKPILYPDLMATIGLALPWISGAHVADSRRPIWAFVGDGSFSYNPGYLRFLANQRSNATIFLFNNAAWSSIRLEQTFIFNSRYFGTALPERDYAALAEYYGCEGMAVETQEDLRAALDRAKEREASGRYTKPLLVDIRMAPDSVPFAGLTFAMAELDYILKPLRGKFFRSLMPAIARRKLPLRLGRMLFRMLSI